MLVFIFCLAIIKIYLDAFAGCEVEGERWRNGAEKAVGEKKLRCMITQKERRGKEKYDSIAAKRNNMKFSY